MTDGLEALSSVQDSSLSIGALTVQPQGTGVILAGTGDPNDALDSYYGGGILRSADGGSTWSLTQRTADPQYNCAGLQDFSFDGEGFAGFAWSTSNTQLVVAAVTQSYEGTLVNAQLRGLSYEGLYYSPDAGVCWYLATITDGTGADVQGPNDDPTAPDGNGATSVVWNPVRSLFIAAVRFHGYYQSPDGVTWTRLAAQPGGGLTAFLCPTNPFLTGSIACPIFRGTLAVNPFTGDTFAWTVDAYNQDQGLWQDQCSITNTGVCANTTVTFAQQWNTQALETSTPLGAATIENGDYTLALAAAPIAPLQGQDTILLAGAQDLWRCSLAVGCEWRNTTNASTCMSAQVPSFQHAMAWSVTNPQEMFLGNDSGLWRSMDEIGESGAVCSASDASHFQNLNGTLGSLSEVTSTAQDPVETYTVMAGLGVNGTAGIKTATGPIAEWPQIESGDGGAVAIDPVQSTNWYVNSQPGVSIYRCSQAAQCSASDFGTAPVITDADVGGDGYSMETPAPFLVDPVDSTQLLIGTCRLWRGPANGSGWNSSNAISPILDDPASTSPCSGDGLIRSIAALEVQGQEVIYVGMFGAADGGGNLAGHVLRAESLPNGAQPMWTDLTLNRVTNDVPNAMNAYGHDISSIFIDSHDATGNTVYVTVEGMANIGEIVRMVYRSTDGGATWTYIDSNLPHSPANAVVVDPQDANTVYVALDAGVWFTTQAGTGACTSALAGCWSEFGIGLPEAPVVGLIASSATAQTRSLTAATYGRGVWQTPLWTAETGLTTAVAIPSNLTFAGQPVGTVSSVQTVTLTNTGSLPLSLEQPATSGDFAETDNCANSTVAAGASCVFQVTFAPGATGNLAGQIVVGANVYGGQIAIGLSGTGTAAGAITLNPASIVFPPVDVGTSSTPATTVEASNGGSQPVTFTAITVTGPFSVSTSFTNACGTGPLIAGSACPVAVTFTPTQSGAAAGALTFTDSAGTQTVLLSGTGLAPATDGLIPSSLTFPNTAQGQFSPPETVTVTNTGDVPLTSILFSVSGEFVIASSSSGMSTGTCTSTLAPHSSCAINVQFAPTQLGAIAGVLTISDSLRTQTVPLTGTGVPPPALSVNPSSLTFPSQPPLVASGPQSVTVTNTGGASLAGLSMQITGAPTGVFSISATSCVATLAAGASCVVQIVFNPQTTGGSAGVLNISSSSPGVAASVGLAGTAQTASGINVSPAMLSFGAVLPGVTSTAQTVTISNSSAFIVPALSVSVSQGFSWTQYTCVGSLAPGASCTIGVSFAPTVSGAASGTLTVSSAAIATAATVTLSGIGAVGASIQVSPGSIDFSTTGVGQTSAPVTLTLTNQGTAASVNGLTLTAPVGFLLVNNTCAATLAAGASCTVGVEFSPQSAGAASGNLTIAATGATTQTIALQGTGFDFTIGLLGPNTQTVSSGLPAGYTVVLTTLGGSQGTFAMNCTTLPLNASCAFTPTSPTVGSVAAGNVALQISTGTVAASLGSSRGGAPIAPLAFGLALLSLGRRRRRKLLLLCGALLLAAGVTSCTKAGPTSSGGSGGEGGGGGSTSTPAGTYSVPVTATAYGVQHSVTVTLVVD
jgi:hypothetical protein